MSRLITNILILIITIEAYGVQAIQNNLLRNLGETIQLKFIDAKNLFYNSTSRKWSFDIKYEIVSQAIDTISSLTVSIYHSGAYTALCTPNDDSILKCVPQKSTHSSSDVIKIKKDSGTATITWSNLSEDVSILLNANMGSFDSAYDLEFIENKWNFFFKGGETYAVNSITTVNVKMVRGSSSTLSLANCIITSTSSTSSVYKCEVESDNQNSNDLVYITKEGEGASVIWKQNILTTDQQIIRLAELTFVKAYDLNYLDSKWYFKIKIEEDLPNQCLLAVDVLYGTNAYSAICDYENRVLSCRVNYASSQSQSNLVKLVYKKNKGSVTWKNSIDDLSIPLITNLNFNGAFGLFFTDKWSFMIRAVSSANLPSNSKVIIDILQNGQDTTASCLFVELNAKNLNLSCISDLETQSKTDTITIKKDKNSGTVTWDFDEPIVISEQASQELLSLEFFEAYDMYFNNKWIFKLSGKYRYAIKIGYKYILDILYVTDDKATHCSTASCISKNGTANAQLFMCTCDYENQEETDLIMIRKDKSESSTITWTKGITEDYNIILKASLTLVRAYNLQYGSEWSFNIEFADAVLPIGSKLVIDIKKNGADAVTNCTTNSNNLILCSFSATSTTLISLTDTKSLKSSVEWKQNLQDDYRIFLNNVLYFVDAYNMIFNETDQKWHFLVRVTSCKPDTKIMIDILYGVEYSTATCIAENNTVFHCVVNEENQIKTTLIKVYRGPESTVTWQKLEGYISIGLLTDLTFEKAVNLRLDPDSDSFWLFDIYVSNNDIPQNSKIIVDIRDTQTNGNNDIIKNSTSNCTYSNGIISCMAEVEKNYRYRHTITLKTTKVKNSLSTVLHWNNVNGKEILPITLTYTLDYGFCTDIKTVNGKHIFYCGVIPNYRIPKYTESFIGIMINGVQKTSFCKGENYTFLKCEIKDEDYPSNIIENIYVLKDKTEESTITWVGIQVDQNLFPISLKYVYAYDGYPVTQGEFTSQYRFKILVGGEKSLEYQRFVVPINHKVYYKTNANDKYQQYDVSACELLNGVLSCLWLCENPRIFLEMDDFNLMLNANGDIIHWSNGGDKTIKERIFYNLNYNGLNKLEYDDENECYVISLKVSGSNDYNNKIIDIKFGEVKSWIFCTVENANLINCISESKEYNPDPEIKLSRTQYWGNVQWNNINNDVSLPFVNDNIIIEISKIFDLKFDSDKWKFKIKTKDAITWCVDCEDTQDLAILINEGDGVAKCTNNNNELLECEVDSASQVNTQLITLSKKSTGKIQIKKMNNQGIPLNVGFKYIKAYDLKYDNQKEEWSFIINAETNSGNTIPNGSTFSTDIKIWNNNAYNNDLAFCTQKGSINNNKITLLCTPQIKVQQNNLISLNSEKSTYSSISWSDLDENIIVNAELNVKKVDNLNYNSGKWSFEMILFDSSLPINSKIMIDILYKNQDATATCTLTENKKFLCIPDVTSQQENDIISISRIKKSGSVTYTNTENLIFPINIQFVKAYGLRLNNENKWEFKISVSSENLRNGQSLIVDIKIDNNDDTANCIYNNYVLSCIVNYNSQRINNEIKLRNNRGREYLIWSNLPDLLDIYMSYDITFIKAYGGFHENKWRFNIYHEPYNQIRTFNNINVLLDIKVNDEGSTALCQIINSKFLNCVSRHDNQNENDEIQIAGNTSPDLGTVYFSQNLNNQQKTFEPVPLEIKYESVQGYRDKNNNKLEFSITGNLANDISYEIGDETITEIEIKIIKSNAEEIESNTICLTNNIQTQKNSYVYLSCYVEENVMENDQVLINVDENGDSHYVKFLPAESISISISDVNNNNNNNNGGNKGGNSGGNKGGSKDGSDNQTNIGKTLNISIYSNILALILLLI